MSVFARHIQATVVALNWRRTLVIEQGRWEPRSTSWKPHGDNVRNLRTVHSNEPDTVGGRYWSGGRPQAVPGSGSYEVLSQHTHFEYEEHTFHNRLFTAKGEGPADLRWPTCTLGPDQRVSERRESYHATFSADAGREFTTELDEATWRTLKVGRRYRLKVGVFSDEVKQVTLAGASYSYRGKLPGRRDRARLGIRTDHCARQGYGAYNLYSPIQWRASADAPLNPEVGRRWTLSRS